MANSTNHRRSAADATTTYRRALENFVDLAAHDFRTPLTVIQQAAELLGSQQMAPLSSDQQRLIEVVRDRAAELDRLVDDMLDSGRLDNKSLVRQAEATSIADLLASVHAKVQRQAASRGIEIEIVAPPALPTVYCDPARCERIITSLIARLLSCGSLRETLRVRAHAADDQLQMIIDTVSQPYASSQHSPSPLDRSTQIAASAEQLHLKDAKDASESDLETAVSPFAQSWTVKLAQRLLAAQLGELHVTDTDPPALEIVLPLARPASVLRKELQRILQQRGPNASVALLAACIEQDIPREATRVLDGIIRYDLTADEMVYRLKPGVWVILLMRSKSAITRYIRATKRLCSFASRHQPHGALPPIQWDVSGPWPCELAAVQVDTVLANLVSGPCDGPSRDEPPRDVTRASKRPGKPKTTTPPILSTTDINAAAPIAPPCYAS